MKANSNKQGTPGKKKLHFKYDTENLEISILRLSHLLDGRDDTLERRDLFEVHDEKSSLDWTIIKQDNLLYPKWCIDELRLLKIERPGIYAKIIGIGINYTDGT